MKTVKYKGQVFTVPDWAKFIAADADGKVWAYSEYPDTKWDKNMYMGTGGESRANLVGELEVKRGKVKEIK